MAQKGVQDYRLLKGIVIVLGLLLVLGMAGLVYGLVSGAGKSKRKVEANAAPAAALRLSADARIADMAFNGDALALRIEDDEGEAILIVDAKNGAIRRELRLSRMPAP